MTGRVRALNISWIWRREAGQVIARRIRETRTGAVTFSTAAEVYVDYLAQVAYTALPAYARTEQCLIDLISLMFTEAVLHELCHELGDYTDLQARHATGAMLEG